MEREKGFREKMGQTAVTRHRACCLPTTNPFNTPFLLSLPCPSPIHPVFPTFPPSPTHHKFCTVPQALLGEIRK